MGIIVFISIVGGLLAAGFIYFLVKILGRFKYYLLLVIVLLLSYWWFIYREMSIVEYYRTADYYDNLSQEDVKNLDEMVRVLFVASYLGNERKFLDNLKSRICQDLSNYELEKHYTRVYKLPLFIGRNSHDNHFFGENSEFVYTIWNASDSSKLILFKHYSKEIDLNCNEKAIY